MSYAKLVLVTKKLLIFVFVVVFFLIPNLVVAQWCAGGPESGVNTALGCLHTNDLNTFVEDLLRWAAGIASFAALAAFAFAGFTIMTAAGDPKKIKAGQELIISAVEGVILIIISVILLNFIGIKILDIGNLGF